MGSIIHLICLCFVFSSRFPLLLCRTVLDVRAIVVAAGGVFLLSPFFLFSFPPRARSGAGRGRGV